MKKLFNSLLTLSLVLGMTSMAFANTQPNLEPENLEALSIQLEQMDQELGTESKILTEVDPASLELHFDTIEQAKEFMSSLKVTDGETTYVMSKSGGTVTANKGHNLSVDQSGVVASAAISNRIQASYVDLGAGASSPRYRWSEILGQTSRLQGLTIGNWEWVQDFHSESIVDAQRTIVSSIEGVAYISGSIGGVPVSMSKNFNFYDEFYISDWV